VECPGEKLLIKLWDTIAEQGIGSLLQPWQIRRVGRANADVLHYEQLRLAEAGRDVDAIRKGNVALTSTGDVVALPIRADNQDLLQSSAHSPTTSTAYFEQVAQRNTAADAVRKEISIAKAVLFAEEELAEDQSEPTEEPISEDWLLRWRNCAANVSSEDLQILWGKILAGELKNPGRFSLRSLEFVKNLSKREAKLIEKIAPFVIENFITKEILEWSKQEKNCPVDNRIQEIDLIELEELGILNRGGGPGYIITLESIRKEEFCRVIKYFQRAILVKHDLPSKRLDISAIKITDIGSQIIKICNPLANFDYFIFTANKIKQKGFYVSIGNFRLIDNETINLFELEEI
jgi:hypothetical protein